MKTRYIPHKNDANVIFFNKTHYPKTVLKTIPEITEFLKKEGYHLLSFSDTEIVLNKGSINGAISFINYKFDLFRDVKFEYEQTGTNDCLVYIMTNI